MAEQKREEFRIHLHVYDEEIEVVLADRTEEEYYRAAAKLITDRYNIYAQRYKAHKSDHTIALMTLVDIALQYSKDRAKNDTAPYNDILNSLTAEIEDALGEKK
ncbi:MAG: cell division protein ZapA [Prevotella sp.]|nr:cell division protein ZapA [Prevotella sp.]